jgi:hypothetical protein
MCPASVTEALKPQPLLLGVWLNCGKNATEPYIAAPLIRATRFVVHTPGNAIRRRSMGGLVAVISAYNHAAISAADATSRIRTVGDTQPDCGRPLMPSSSVSSQPVSSSAGASEMPVAERAGDSGISRIAAAAPAIAATAREEE